MLRARQRPALGQGRARGRASPPGWRRRTPTTAAPSSPRRSPTPSSSRPADIWKKVRARHRGQPAARRAPGRRPDLRRRRRGDGRDRRQPGALPRQEGRHRDAAPTPSSTTLALARLAANDSESAAGAAGRSLGARAAAPTSRRTPGRASRGRPRSSCSPRPPTSSCAPAASLRKSGREIELSDDTLAWKARAALRADNGRARWQQVVQAINAMTPAEQKDAAWVYWKARGLQALARDSQDGESLLATSRELLGGIAGAAELLRRARRRGPRPAAGAAAAAGAARRPPSATPRPPTPASRAR